MLIDSHDITHANTIRTRVCIIGAGAAGITIARELNQTNTPVVLLESGEFTFKQETQSLYKGDTTVLTKEQDDYLETSRLRFFGGTINHWAGNCRPLDPIDFEKRSWIPYSGWAIGREELDKYYPQATELCQIGPFETYSELSLSQASPGFSLQDSKHVEVQVFQTGPPTRFGAVYRKELIDSKNVTVYTHANVLNIATNPEGSVATHVEVASLEGNRFRIAADVFVLATGGIENARVLLLSDSVQKKGLGNDHGLVGRFFSEHPAGRGVAQACLWASQEELAFFTEKRFHADTGSRVWGVFSIKEDIQRAYQLHNCCMRILPAPISYKQRLLSLIGNGNAKRWDICQTSLAVDALRNSPAARAAQISPVQINIPFEAAPNPENRVTLINNRLDSLGQRRVSLQWNISEQDLDSMWRTLKIFGHELGKNALGRVRLNKTEGSYSFSLNNHHMGSTRMHNDPRQGVVDSDCRVHSVANLYVAGSSVFPTFGYANPTLTIVALAVRLAKHIRKLTSE